MSRRAGVLAPAKVNLSLRVLGKRPDGYHDIDTLFQAIDLADEVSVGLSGSGIRLDVEGPDPGPLDQNLAYRAAAMLRRAVGFDDGVRIRLTKRVPAGAGLGGGSSDGAAVLRCLSTLLDLDEGDEHVARIASQLGSDVPFFLSGSPLARGTGRGDVLESMDPLPVRDLVVVSPPVHVSTAAAYSALAVERRTSGRPASVAEDAAHPPTGWADVARLATNDFQPVIAEINPEITRAIEVLEDAGASLAMMSGSGSSVFGLFDSRASAERVAHVASQELGWPCRPARTLADMPPVGSS